MSETKNLKKVKFLIVFCVEKTLKLEQNFKDFEQFLSHLHAKTDAQKFFQFEFHEILQKFQDEVNRIELATNSNSQNFVRVNVSCVHDTKNFYRIWTKYLEKEKIDS